jgi:threonine/homoserine/homoserine lactone efflux protein
MINDILIGIPWGFILSFLPGAVFFVLLETSVIKGFRAALAFNLGVISSDIIFIMVAYFSSYRLIQSIKDEPALFLFGGLLMVTYGIVSFIKVKKAKNDLVNNVSKEIIKKNYFSLFIKGFLLNFINVGVLGFWLTIIITTGPKLNMDPGRMLTFFIAVVTTYFTTDLFKIILAKQLRSKLTAKNIIKIKKIISFILMIFGIALLFEGFFPADKEIVNSAIDRIENKE